VYFNECQNFIGALLCPLLCVPFLVCAELFLGMLGLEQTGSIAPVEKDFSGCNHKCPQQGGIPMCGNPDFFPQGLVSCLSFQPSADKTNPSRKVDLLRWAGRCGGKREEQDSWCCPANPLIGVGSQFEVVSVQE